MTTKAKFKCKICGNVWEAMPYHIATGEGCKKCGYKKAGEALKMTNKAFCEKLKAEQPNIKPLEKYKSNHEKIKCKCKKCGNVWFASPHGLLGSKKSGCPKCAIKKLSKAFMKTNNQFIKDLKNKTKNIVSLEEYRGNKNKILFKCKRCNFEWKAMPKHILHNASCPKCSISGTSYVEQVIYLTLKKIIGNNQVFSRDKKAIGKELDIYIPKYKFAIEYGSWYWHRNRLDKDKEKRNLCKKMGIDLIQIYDFVGNKKSLKNIWYYKDYIGDDNKKIGNLLAKIVKCLSIKISKYQIYEIMSLVIHDAENKSLKMGEQEFLDKIREISPMIKIQSHFNGIASSVKCLCKKCGYEWETTPRSLLVGKGCKICGYKSTSKKLTMQHEDFICKLKEKNSNAKFIKILGKYNKSNEKIKCRCLKCGKIWYTTPHILLDNHGCPECSNKMFVDDFLLKFKKNNKNYSRIQLLSKFNGIDKKIKYRCKMCGNVFETKAVSLVAGHGCKFCNHKTISHNDFINKLKIKNKKYNEFIVLDKYELMRKKIRCKCKKCGKIWYIMPTNLLSNHGCPYCYGTKKKTTKEFLKELKQKNKYSKYFSLVSNYVNAKTKIKCKCKLCGNEWSARPSAIITSHGCPKCHSKG